MNYVHTLEDIDLRKRSLAFRDLAAVEVAKNYTIAKVVQNLCVFDQLEDRKLLIDENGWHLLLKDVYNASVAWKKKFIQIINAKKIY